MSAETVHEIVDGAVSPKSDVLEGTVIDGRYRVDRKLGEGGMGVVYAGAHTVLGKRVAIKVLRPELAADGDVVQRFIQEAQTASSIGHENIVDISDFGRLTDGSVFFVMEYLDGESLSGLIQRGCIMPMERVTEILSQIAEALAAAHSRGIIHRDLKPDNIFLIRRGDNPFFAKVLDFGIAKVGTASNKLTKTGMLFGTPHYMSPEQAAGQAVDGRTDIYALGVIMYEMVTGRVPFESDSFMGVLSKQMFEAPVPPGELIAQPNVLPKKLEKLILRTLEKRPEDRYASMDELATALNATRDDSSIIIGGSVNHPDGSPTQVPMRSGIARTSERTLDILRIPHKKRSKTIIMSAVGGFLLLASGLTAMMLNRPSTPPKPSIPAVTPKVPTDPTVEATEKQNVQALGAVLVLDSEPTGASVIEDGQTLGQTPVVVVKPKDAIRKAQLQLAGFLSQEVSWSHTSPEKIIIHLEPINQEKVTGGTKEKNRVTKGARTGSTNTPSNNKAGSKKGGGRNSELLDAWD